MNKNQILDNSRRSPMHIKSKVSTTEDRLTSRQVNCLRPVLIILICIFSIQINKIIILTLPIAFITNYLRNSIIARKQQERFERDYPTFLISLSSSIKCGLDPLVALIQVKNLFKIGSPIFEAIEQLQQKISAGASEARAIKSFASNINHPDIVLFKDAFVLARGQGASLSSCLHRIARVVRARQSFKRKAKTAVAMQKLSAIGILISVFFMLGIQFVSSHETLKQAWQDPLGMKLLLLAGGLVLIGLIGMFKVSQWEA